jgi:hypothetical protein
LLTRRRLIKPWIPIAASSGPITLSDTVEGFEGAGMGRVIELMKPQPVSKIVEAVKEHLSLEHGQYKDSPRSTANDMKSASRHARLG